MTDDSSADALPLLLAGPILRRCTPERLTIWIATSAPVRVRVRLGVEVREPAPRTHRAEFVLEPGTEHLRSLRASAQLHFVLLDVRPASPLPCDRWIDYELALQRLDNSPHAAAWIDCTDEHSGLPHAGRRSPGFVLPSRVSSVLHGSCRKPHFAGRDGLARADLLFAQLLRAESDAHATDIDSPPAWPSALLLTGDQVYMDDVAGPMLRAIHHLVERLGLPSEPLPTLSERGIADSRDLYAHADSYYRRERLLPRRRRDRALVDILFRGVEKPVFTSANAHNHLITLGEMLAMYVLAWSPIPWHHVSLEPPAGLSDEHRQRYARERVALEHFVAELPAVRRVLAHVPVAMIFDDHDITDDWNISREWEEIAYGHPFSRRVIGNALVAYAICQA